MNQSISRRTALRGLVAFGLVPAASACSDDSAPTVDGADGNLGFAGTVLGEPLAKPTIAFTDTEGRPYDFADETKGRLTLLFFGYTSCPDICPITLSIIESALRELSGPAAETKVVFVGVDTARDTPRLMREYLDARGDGFVGLSTSASLDELNRALSLLLLPGVTIAEPEPDGSYVVGHPGQVLVYSPDDTAHIMYQYGVTKADWVADLPRLADFDWPVTTR